MDHDGAIEIIYEALQGVSYVRRDSDHSNRIVVEHEVDGDWFTIPVTVGEPSPRNLEKGEAMDENRTILVHLNVTVPAGDKRTPEEIASAIEGALEVGSDEDSMRDLDIAVLHADEL